jgi:hypothetical protein
MLVRLSVSVTLTDFTHLEIPSARNFQAFPIGDFSEISMPRRHQPSALAIFSSSERRRNFSKFNFICLKKHPTHKVKNDLNALIRFGKVTRV